MKVLFPHPTLTDRSLITSKTMKENYTSATAAVDTAANAAGGSTTDQEVSDEEDISSKKVDSEDDSKDKASDDNKGMEDRLFCAARDIQNRMSRCIRTAGMEDCHFCISLAQIYPL